MSIDQRIRSGLQRPGPDADRDTLAALHRVEQRLQRRARRTRTVVGALVAAVTVLVVGGAVALQQDRADRDQVAIDGASSSGEIEGTYVVDVADSRALRREGVTGRWLVTLGPEGVLEVRPPAGYTGGTTGMAYRVDGARLRTDALTDPGCQVDSGYVGIYAWDLSDDVLTFTTVEDRCAARRALFGGQPWDRVP